VVSNGYTSKCSWPYGLIRPFNFWTFGHSGAQDCVPEYLNVKKIKNGGLDLYGAAAECFGRLIYATTRKSVGLKGLTLSPPIPLRLYTLPYRSNPPLLIFDIRALWRSGLSARAPECQKLKVVGLDQYDKVQSLNGIGDERVKLLSLRSFSSITRLVTTFFP